MFRLRSKSGDESVFRTPEEIRAALLSGFVTPDAQIWDAELKGWVPLLEHALYQQIAATPGGRKSNAVKAPPASPTTAKPVQKLVIRRPGEAAPPAAPVTPPPPPPAPKPPVVDEGPELEMLDIDLSMEEEPAAAPPAPPKPTLAPPPVAAQPPRPSTPPPAAAPPPPPPPRVSAPKVPAPRISAASPTAEARPVMRSMHAEEEGGSKKGLIIAAVVVVLAAAGGGFALLRGRGADATAQPDSTALAATAVHVAATDSAPDSTASAIADSQKVDSTAAVAATVDTAKRVAADTTKPDTTTAPVVAGVPFAPMIDRGFTSWNSRPATAAPLSVPELEAVRLRYVASQARALEQFEAGLEAIGFADMFNPSRVGRQDRREEALEGVEAGKEALQDFRRHQAAVDFAYTDTLRQALPAGSDEPDLRTFGPSLRETPAQAALTDSLLTEVNDMYTLLVNTPGGFTLKGRDLVFKDAAKGEKYRVMVEQLTAQLGRLRSRPGSEIPPAMGGILRGIGLPR